MKTHAQLEEYLLGTTFNRLQMDQVIHNILVFAAPGIAPELPQTVGESPAPVAQNTASASAKVSGFRFGKGSEKELVGVHETLVKVTRRALELCDIDFVVFDGIRTYKEQQQHVRNGTSKTMASKHLDGLAVDLVPYIGGKPTWDWNGCYRIALAMDSAATELGVANRIRWGGAWDRTLADFGGDSTAYKAEVDAYVSRHPGPDFIDGPHFEWLK